MLFRSIDLTGCCIIKNSLVVIELIEPTLNSDMRHFCVRFFYVAFWKDGRGDFETSSIKTRPLLPVSTSSRSTSDTSQLIFEYCELRCVFPIFFITPSLTKYRYTTKSQHGSLSKHTTSNTTELRYTGHLSIHVLSLVTLILFSPLTQACMTVTNEIGRASCRERVF